MDNMNRIGSTENTTIDFDDYTPYVPVNTGDTIMEIDPDEEIPEIELSEMPVIPEPGEPFWKKIPPERLRLILWSALAGVVVLAIAVTAICIGFSRSHVKLNGKWLSIRKVETLTLDRLPTEEELEDLTRCTRLQLLDMRGVYLSEKEYARLSGQLPGCEIRWKIPLGDGIVDSSAQTLFLGDISPEKWDVIEYMPHLTAVDLSGCTDYDALSLLAAEYPDIDFVWTVDVLGEPCPNDTQTLDLSGAAIEDVSDLVSQLSLLTELSELNLSGSSLTPDQIVQVRNSLPACDIRWTYTLYGKEYSSDEVELDLRGTGIRKLDELTEMLPYLDHVKKIYLTDLDIPSKKIETLADSYPGIKFVWRLKLVFWSVMTDATGFSTRNSDPPSYRLTTGDARKLRFCTELEALDLGHNSITDISFLRNMPKLKILIIADNMVKDISVLSELKELEYVELFLNPLTDVSPLAQLPKLQDVNLSFTRVKDFSPLYGMDTVRRLWLNGSKLNRDARAQLAESMDDCRIVFDGSHSTSDGWRDCDRYDWMIGHFN